MIRVGDRVEAGDGDDYDTGEVLAIIEDVEIAREDYIQ